MRAGESRALTLQLRLEPGLLLYKALNYFVLKTNKQKSDFQPARIFNCFLITYERTMGIGLCKYLKRFSMMPDFHSAVNVFILLLLSYGFNFHSENVPSAEKTKAKSRCMAFFLSVQARAEERLPRASSAAQWVAAASRKPSRRLPLTDYNL